MALYINETGNFYNFSNIRYAAPPLDSNRFRAPQPPAENRTVTQSGGESIICPQAPSAWEVFAQQFLPSYLQGQPSNLTIDDLNAINASLTLDNIPPPSTGTTEDCLFLDLAVPKTVFDKESDKLAPVLVWIYGGAYTLGNKVQYPPPGLLYRSEQGGREPIIFVAMNYRLGAYGWLAGPAFQASGTANNGLLDQRAALDWVQANIDKFGGDKDRVTVLGESAGGGSIIHHLTAYGGQDTPPFQQAISQSGAFQPLVSDQKDDNVYARLLELSNVTTFEELQALPAERLYNANALQVWQSFYGQATYGPAVDGSYVPALPGVLFQEGRFNKQVRVVAGRNSQEGIGFTNPFVSTEDEVRAFLQQFLSTASPEVLDYIQTTLYPPAPYTNGSLSYTDAIGRLSAIVQDSAFVCNSYYVDTAYAVQDTAYGYYFEVPPGIHGQDIVYTFYEEQAVDPARLLFNTTTAIALQDYVTTFAQSGIPSSPDVPGLPAFPSYAADSQLQDLQLSSIGPIADPQNNYRCQWWQQAFYV